MPLAGGLLGLPCVGSQREGDMAPLSLQLWVRVDVPSLVFTARQPHSQVSPDVDSWPPDPGHGGRSVR